MGKLEKSLEKFVQKLNGKAGQTNTLISDMEQMINGLKNKKPYSRQTLEPMTRLRKNEADAIKAKENPDMQFVRDRTHDIFGI
jgi:hypothetical protein